MSRSRKKYPCVKDNATHWKKVCSRMHRRVSRRIAKGYSKHFELYELGLYHISQVEIEDPEFPSPRALVDSYDICDWKSIDFNNPKYFRK